jgi:preprotein translocase subunit SecB
MQPSDNKLTEGIRSDEQISDLFNTNRQYVHDIEVIKTEQPEVYEQIKSGDITISKAKKNNNVNNAPVTNSTTNNKQESPRNDGTKQWVFKTPRKAKRK